VTSTGTMDKASTAAREHIASLADLVGAVRLPECTMRASAGTDVVIDVLVFRRRAEGQAPGDQTWIDLAEIAVDGPPADATPDGSRNGNDEASLLSEAHAELGQAPYGPRTVAINAYFAAHPEMVLGTHALRRGIYGPGPTYICRARPGDGPMETMLDAALARLP